LAAILAGFLLLPTAGLAHAQEPLPPAAPPAPQAAAPSGDNTSSLQAQIGELQAMVAALQSLVQQRPDVTLPQESAAAAPQGAGPDAAGLTSRVDALETQIGALSGQLEMMTQQLGALQAKLNEGGGDAPQPLAPGNEYQPEYQPMPDQGYDREGTAPAAPSNQSYASAGEGDQFSSSIFSDSTEALPPRQAGRSDAPLPLRAGEPLPEASQSVAALPSGHPVSLYNQGYGDLLRRDYASAEMSFRKLLNRFPDDALAGKAQYWLGETYYVRGQFKDAAEAFLKSYKQYQAGEKAPDSLLKLGMALGELGQKDAACSTLNEFGAKYPGADSQLQGQVRGERIRLGC
jgi:tol-pal system protein YbgF